MNRKTHQNKKISPSNLVARLIPRVEGAFGVQALASGHPGIDIGVYRPTIREAEAWVQRIAPAGKHECFLLGEGKSWRVYDQSGKQVARGLRKLPGRPLEERKRPVVVDRTKFLEDAVIATGRNDLVCLAMLEDHAGANCADQTNYEAITRRLVAVADEEDLNHIHIVESRRWPCRVAGLFAAFPKLSQEIQNRFLHYHQHLSRSEPLEHTTHLNRLARRLARWEHVEIGQVLRHVFEKAESEEGLFLVDRFLSAPLRQRQRYVWSLLAMQRYKSEPGSPESLDFDSLENRTGLAVTFGIQALYPSEM